MHDSGSLIYMYVHVPYNYSRIKSPPQINPGLDYNPGVGQALK